MDPTVEVHLHLYGPHLCICIPGMFIGPGWVRLWLSKPSLFLKQANIQAYIQLMGLEVRPIPSPFAKYDSFMLNMLVWARPLSICWHIPGPFNIWTGKLGSDTFHGPKNRA